MLASTHKPHQNLLPTYSPPTFPHVQLLGLAPPSKMARALPVKIEPKTFFANERTFLAWLHMAVTIGSISAALLGFAAGATFLSCPFPCDLFKP